MSNACRLDWTRSRKSTGESRDRMPADIIIHVGRYYTEIGIEWIQPARPQRSWPLTLERRVVAAVAGAPQPAGRPSAPPQPSPALFSFDLFSSRRISFSIFSRLYSGIPTQQHNNTTTAYMMPPPPRRLCSVCPAATGNPTPSVASAAGAASPLVASSSPPLRAKTISTACALLK